MMKVKTRCCKVSASRADHWVLQHKASAHLFLVEDLYLVPSVYRDTARAFFERHEARIENLAEQGSPKVLLTVDTVVRREMQRTQYFSATMSLKINIMEQMMMQ